MILKVKTFELLGDYKIRVVFNNDIEKIVDLEKELDGEVFQPLKDRSFFKKAFLTEWHVIEWPNGADFAPEFLFKIGRL